jgi:hypothetical protein
MRESSRRLNELINNIKVELKFGVPCYEDGTLSPRGSFQLILLELEVIKLLLDENDSLSCSYIYDDSTSSTKTVKEK